MSRAVDDRLSAWLDGALDPEDRAEVERLVRDDPAWAHRVAELRALSAAVRDADGDDALPPGFHARTRALFVESRRPRWGGTLWRWRYAGAALAALLLVAIFLPHSFERQSRLGPPVVDGGATSPSAAPPIEKDAPAAGPDDTRSDASDRRERAGQEFAASVENDVAASQAAPAPDPARRSKFSKVEADAVATSPRTVPLPAGWPGPGVARVVLDRAGLDALHPQAAGAAFVAWALPWDGRGPLLLAGAPADRVLDCSAPPVEVDGVLEFRVRSLPAAPGEPGSGCAIAPGPLPLPATLRIVDSGDAP